MGRKVHRVPVQLNSGEVKGLPIEDVKMILRAADELISTGGRSMLVKILKGSKDKKVLEYHLDECPAYGYYHDLTMDEIGNRVDWIIEQDYLRIEYNYRLPVLIFSEIGWKIERETFAEEIYQRFCQDVKEKHPRIIFEMKDVNRQVVLDVLDKIESNGTAEFIPLLEEWKQREVKKIRTRINAVERVITGIDSSQLKK
ncbi:MAG: RQC-minor-1 family DNA-binding protein [Clostridiaceae bacterium]